LLIALILLTLAIIASFLSHVAQPFELVSHFSALLAVAAMLLFLLCLPSKNLKLILFSATALVIATARLVPLYLPDKRPEVTANSTQIKILHLNCWGPKNHTPDEVFKIAAEDDVDVICFNEIEQAWAQRIEQNCTKFPFKALYPHVGGVGMVSKFPIKNWKMEMNYGCEPRPRIVATITLPNGLDVALLVVHPTIPVYMPKFELRNSDFEKFVTDLAGRAGPKLIVGDLNCTPWSWYFFRLLQKTNLKDSECGFGIQPSWIPGGKPLPLLPIDHVLVSPDIQVLERRIERDAGSDHRPLFVKLSINKG
jgi:endonuclease/exonuclease/phosphatase (EEP) superfamily protein YafD